MARLGVNRLDEIKKVLLAEFKQSVAIAGMGHRTINRQEHLVVYLMKAEGSDAEVPFDDINRRLAELVPDMPVQAVKDPEYYDFLNQQ